MSKLRLAVLSIMGVVSLYMVVDTIHTMGKIAGMVECRRIFGR